MVSTTLDGHDVHRTMQATLSRPDLWASRGGSDMQETR